MKFLYCGNGKVGELCHSKLIDFNLDIYNCPIYQFDSIDSIIDRYSPDILLSIHWPYKFTKSQLNKIKIGSFNLHNSYLPWNRGADACSWAIIDNTPHGATFHWIDEGIDTGDIFYQQKIDITEEDTTDSLYKKTINTEIEVFEKAIDMIVNNNFLKIRQEGKGSFHRKKDFSRIIRAACTNQVAVVNKE